MVELKFRKIVKDIPNPVKAYKDDACWDLFCAKDTMLIDNVSTHIPLGIAVGIPKGYELQIRARSSLGKKYNAVIPNGLGVIDSGFSDEIKFIMMKIPKRDVPETLKEVPKIEWKEVKRLPSSERGKNGLGSTGDR